MDHVGCWNEYGSCLVAIQAPIFTKDSAVKLVVANDFYSNRS